ncbi:MAG: hypothetical protein QXV77_06540 [Candidatus Bathyarchaeia archaeon]
MNSVRSLVRKVADDLKLNKNNLCEFLNLAFEEASKEFNLYKDYQSRAEKFGETFEECFQVIMEKLFPDIPLEREVSLPKACIASGGEADFAVFSDDFLESFNKRVVERKLIAVIEAKGAAEYITCDGKRIKLPRPGLLRTDTVKKAICNAYQGLIQTHSFSKSQTCRRKC